MIGKKILHYQILEKLGEGGMGIVYKAEDTKLKRFVAIKFLPDHIAVNQGDHLRFEQEAQTAASINHPNITQIFAFEEYEGKNFISMEYIDGVELKDKLDSAQLSFDEIISISKKIAEGLKEAHSKQIIHRDIKASNIMIADKGSVKIMDFGLANIASKESSNFSGLTVGTVNYMSPEQAQDDDVDKRTDIWSFGVLLYQMLTGKLPFTGNYEQAIIYSVLNEEPDPITDFRSDTPPQLISIVEKCLKKNKDDRYENAEELLSDFVKLYPANVSEDNNSASEYIQQSERRTKKLYYLFGAISLVFILIILFRNDLLQSFNINSTPDKKHLVVLPVKNISEDKFNQAFCDGLLETLTSSLTKMGQFDQSLWVVPTSEVRKDHIESASDANSAYGVNLAVTGSVQLLNEVVRLTLNLVDAKNLRQLNSIVIDVNKSNLAELQDNSVSKLISMLNLELNETDAQKISDPGTSVPSAYDFYLQGNGYLLRYEDENNLKLAIKLFEQAIQEDSAFANAYAGLSEAYWFMFENSKRSNFINDALEAANKAYQLNNELASVNIALGNIKLGTGNYKEAVEYFNSALDTEPNNAEAMRGLAKSYEKQGKIDEAEKIFKRAITLKPDYWAGYNDLGVFYFGINRYNEAIKQFKQILKLTPDNYRGYSNLGGIYYILEMNSEAEKMFEKSLSIRKSYRAASNLGTLYYIQGKFKEATETYELALSLNENDYIVWGNLGAAYYWSGKKVKSISAFKQAIKLAEERFDISKGSAKILADLANYYSMINNKSKTLKLAERAINNSPEDGTVLYLLGAAYEKIGMREKAIEYILKSIEMGYSKSEILNQPELKKLIADENFNNKLNK